MAYLHTTHHFLFLWEYQCGLAQVQARLADQLPLEVEVGLRGLVVAGEGYHLAEAVDGRLAARSYWG